MAVDLREIWGRCTPKEFEGFPAGEAELGIRLLMFTGRLLDRHFVSALDRLTYLLYRCRSRSFKIEFEKG
jgi:hypothetical protein